MEAATSVAAEEEATRRSRGRGKAAPLMVGSYVTKNFPDGSGTLLGKVVSGGGRFYSAIYEDGRREELEIKEIRRILLPSPRAHEEEEEKLAPRKKKLEQILSEEITSTTRSMRRKLHPAAAQAPPDRRRRGRKVSIPVIQGEDVDSSTDSSEFVPGPNDANPVPTRALELPPSSCSVGISDESVGCLLSVYSFLRAFSVALFLSPFVLGDFVGSLNCTFQNSLLDAIHVSLLRALRRHVDVLLSAEGSQPASKCLRRLDWSMLDTLTWPVYVLEYLFLGGHIRGREWKEFGYGRSEEEEYYSLSAEMKLKILQILCDAVLDSGELRTELDSRKGADEEGEYADLCDNAVEEIVPKEAELPEDGNSDECRICGMDGMLLCCDGCPSAYHSRCIGLGKDSLPDGNWFCPECAADQIAPEFAKMTSGIRGAELFGTDPYGRAFIGACNYLLVLSASSNTEEMSRYYDQGTVREVLKFLCSSEDYSPFYADICKEIAKYWAISADEYCLPTAASILENGNPPGEVEESQRFPAFKMSPDRGRESISNVSQRAPEIGMSSQNMDADLVAGVSVSENGSANQGDNRSVATEKISNNVDVLTSSTCVDGMNQLKSSHMIDQDSDLLSSRSFSQLTGLTDLANQRIGDKSSLRKDLANSVPFGTIAVFRDDADSQISPFSGGRQLANPSSAFDRRLSPLETGLQSRNYVNQYMLGEVAASAAADLVALDLDKSTNHKSVTNTSSLQVRQRKVVSATIAVQLKAFAKASTRFVWTNAERKLLESPKERCGWCISCKGMAINKKGCLLNLALLHAAKASLIRGHTGIRPPVKIYKNSHISAVATYILNMAGHLSGLIIGPLANPAYKKRWCASVRDASSCSVLRPLLLELEKSIRRVAFNAEWFKLFDDGLLDQVVARGVVVPVQKRGPGRPKNSRKLMSMEPTSAASAERVSEINVWWRGVRLSRVLFQKSCLSRSLAKKTARQGGAKCISGVNYSGNSYNLRTRQLAWRTAVEASMSASQLALQVRLFDAHIRWKDLVRPEQMPSEMVGRGAESDASAFRNAIICGVQASPSGNKTRYALVFGDPKQLPSSITKNILETETDEDAKEKFWFAENNVPLYLIKDYEERARKEGGASSANHRRKEVGERSSSMRKMQRRQLRAFRRDIFSYLLSREDNPLACSCASCCLTLLVREAVRCSNCQGYCHEGCFFAPLSKETDPEHDSLCKQCHLILFPPPTAKNEEQLKNNNTHSTMKIINLAGGGATLAAAMANPGLARQPKVWRTVVEASPPSNGAGRRQGTGHLPVTYGLVWRRKSGDGGEQFRRYHVIPKGGDSVRRPVCVLCAKDYDPSAMYVRCERCLSWVHAEAVLLEEHQVMKLMGFKCGKCRRKSSPRCPYEDCPGTTTSTERSVVSLPVAAEVKAEEFAAALRHEDAGMSTSRNMNPDMDTRMSSSVDMGVDIDLDFDIDVDIDMNMSVEAGMESEPPQTYFSFTELLEAPDDSHLDAQLEEFQRSLLPVSSELVCRTCGVACLPWAASAAGFGASADGSWKCAACRDWE